MKLAALIVLSVLPAAAQWSEFVSRYGRPPVDYTNPAATVEKWKAWFADAQPALDRYAILVQMNLHCRGFVLDLSEFEARQPWGWSFRGRVSKDGLQIEYLLQWGSPFDENPEQVADRIAKKWSGLVRDIQNNPKLEIPEGLKVVSWKEVFLSTGDTGKPVCVVVNNPGQTCQLDLGSGTFKTKEN